MLLTTTNNCSPTSSRKRSTTTDAKNSTTAKKRPKVDVSYEAASGDYSLAPLNLQQLMQLATAATHHHYSITPSHAKRQKKDIIWPSLTAIAQLQAPDNWYFSATDKSHATEIRSIGQEFQSVKFHPLWSNFGTAGIRATKHLNGGIHYWQILIPGRVFGTSMMVGIGTQNARVHADGFVHLLGGLDDDSWGLCHNGQLYHAGRYIRYTSPLPADEPTVIGVLFDGVDGTLTFYRDGRCLGVAFSGILTAEHAKTPNQPRFFFPMLSSTSAQTEMILCCQLRNYTSLQDRCRSIIAHSIDYSVKRVDDLPLPDQLKSFVRQEVSSHLV